MEAFDFEKYWETTGIKTDPAIMGMAFKECAQKAVAAAELHYKLKTPKVRVRTTSPKHYNYFLPELIPLRKWGVKGYITEHHNAHGISYKVEHDDGSYGYYTPDELEFII